MHIVEAAQQKLQAALSLVRALKAGDFPHKPAKVALSGVEDLLVQHLKNTEKLTPASSPDVVFTQCGHIFATLHEYLYVLGLLYRSKNSSNAFELYRPLERLAHRLIGEDVQLILSSEWDFSPFTVLGVPDLQSFVWVGLPASESSNALLIPLAGHEFGHSVWQRSKLDNKHQMTILEAIIGGVMSNWSAYRTFHTTAPKDPDESALLNDMFLMRSWWPALQWGMAQAEEAFCDAFGVRVFGTAYLHAFTYLLAPGQPDRGDPRYPSLPRRTKMLSEAATTYGYAIPTRFEESFQSVAEGPDDENTFWLTRVDEGLSAAIDDIVKDADAIATSRGVNKVDDKEVERAVTAYGSLVPDGSATDIAAVVNAGWEVTHDDAVWSRYPNALIRKREALNELILKTAQVLEFNLLKAEL